ncbi:helix-turn-helix domain-containing protein [Planctellipticum variicoloris]|uniref:helix-turn-helix domain-containing protein n=1 Tax=Planctellipticum variicoloris TaxID=3064265 RepID=UPI003013EAEA|nr:helix-turn-helix domain-containing protein [Planctomycetaceae bacterium SH412]
MRLVTHEPAAPLGNFIHHFWDCTDAPSHPRERILPSGTIELVVNLREDEVRIYGSAEPERCRRFPGIVVSGTYAGAFVIDPTQHASMTGVHFRPGGAFPFFGGATGELANSHLGLEDLWGRSAVELQERMCSAATPLKRFRILEEMLETRLRWPSEHPAVSLALDIFGPAGIGDSVRAAAKRVGLSQRRFIQVFTAQVGLTPKLFCRVLRFQRAREVVDQTATPNWAQVALVCGYYDQSHLIHDFLEFSDLSPTDYIGLRSNRLLRNHVPLIG